MQLTSKSKWSNYLKIIYSFNFTTLLSLNGLLEVSVPISGSPLITYICGTNLRYPTASSAILSPVSDGSHFHSGYPEVININWCLTTSSGSTIEEATISVTNRGTRWWLEKVLAHSSQHHFSILSIATTL